MDFIKYPKTFHIEGSKFESSYLESHNAHDLKKTKLSVGAKDYLVLEEKMDGSQLGISFASIGTLQFQSRGSFLSGGEGEFTLAKNWAYQHIDELWNLLGMRYVLFGEWLYLKHTIFYDMLPNYFMEYDIFDKNNMVFLSTAARIKKLKNYSFLSSVRVVGDGHFSSADQLLSYVGKSAFISPNARSKLLEISGEKSLSKEQVLSEADTSGFMEGLYIKVESKDAVIGRYKFIRGDFIKKIVNSKGHWKNRRPIANQVI